MPTVLKSILALGLLFCFDNVAVCRSVSTVEVSNSFKLSRTNNNAKKELLAIIKKSKSQKKITATATGKLNNIEIKGVFKFVAPNKYYRQEILFGRIEKESIEVSKQRYEKSNGQWIKVKKDPSPLREEYSNLFFPKFVSKKDDGYKIKRVVVRTSKIKEFNNKKNSVFEYTIYYDDEDVRDMGVVWVNENSKLVNRIETRNVFGANISDGLIVFSYESDLEIVEPKNYIEKDWIN